MQVQFLAGVKKDRSGKVARLKEFELLAIRLNDNNIEVIPTVSKKPLSETPPTKSTVDSDELLASYIACLECLKDLEKDRALGFNNNEANSSTPKANPGRTGRTDAGYRSDRCYGIGARSTFANLCRAESDGPYFS
jgi:hypothetical protein